ncbi:MAG: lipase maturation factor family protein, partial [Verrucomicrobiota bacterium]
MSQPVTSAPVPFAGRLARAGGYLWRETKDFGGWSGDVTHLWSRWLLLRAVGVVYVLIFSGILVEGQALIAPNGIAQLDELFAQLHRTFPNPAEALIRAPSLFWLGTGSGMITLLTWTGLLSAVAVVFNLWPRMALFSCWLVFLSFASTWRSFSPAQLDNLMLEVALVCIPFAPAGFRPGLGAGAPPRRIALFMMRWLLFRVMLQSGLVKLVSGDPHWRDFTVMDVMYETAPFPTILGYLDHQLPQAYHCFEVVLTFTAELLAPVLAVIGGSRGRWFAFGSWVLLQVGIQLTCNFGWLNAAAIGLALLLLDDRMLAAAA